MQESKGPNKLAAFNNHSLYSDLLYITIIFTAVFLFYPFFIDLVHVWQSDPQFSHGFLIPFISLSLIWLKRNQIRVLLKSDESFSPKHSKSIFILLFMGLSMYIIGWYSNEIMVEGISFVFMLGVSVLFIFGVDVFTITFFPICYLLFMIPFPARVLYFFSKPLKYLIAQISAMVIASFGVPVFLEKELINLPSITLLVEEVCSGLKTMLAFSAIGLVYAHLYIRSNYFKVMIIIIALCVAIIMNIIRIAAIGIVAHFYNNDIGMAIHKHGWPVISIMGFSTIFLIGTIFKWIEHRRDY